MANIIDEIVAALLPANITTCPHCKRRLAPHPCHKQGQGEWCSLDEGHTGPHKALMCGYQWEDEDNDKPGSPCWPDGVCHAERWPLGCPLPKNHDGPHQLPPVGHADDCLVLRVERYGNRVAVGGDLLEAETQRANQAEARMDEARTDLDVETLHSTTYLRERDEARAEVERLREGDGTMAEEAWRERRLGAADCQARLQDLRRERDEALAKLAVAETELHRISIAGDGRKCRQMADAALARLDEARKGDPR